MKASPCHAAFCSFHRCAAWHKEKGDADIATPCGKYALALNDCIQTNVHLFPKEVTTQMWKGKQDKGEGDKPTK